MAPRSPRLALTLLGVALGVAAAWARRWTADDAFISFRYARNLVEGHGLVFNAGERVEGYTNFLWTLLMALGLGLEVYVQLWAQALGVLCYAALIAFVGLWPRERTGWPLAALALAAHPDAWTFATSGLETSLFALLCTAGLLLALEQRTRGDRLRAGAVLALAVLTRPDGALVAAAGCLGAALLPAPSARARVQAALDTAAPVLVLAGGHLAFRLAYYGALVPNTFFAKSTALAWYDQGLAYLGFFLQRSWGLAFGLGTALVLMRQAPARAKLQVATLAAAAVAYTFFVVRVGGDFMYARLLVPVIPLVLLALERAAAERPRVQLTATLVLVAAFSLSPLPAAEAMWSHGIVDERTFPDPQRAQEGRAATLRRYFEGLPVRVAFTGGDARLMYRARIPVAIESETGLTDRFIARQPLGERGRVGHEKSAPLDYLVRTRGAHFVFRRRALAILNVPEHLPLVEVQLGDVRGWLLHWDPALMAELRRRGARVIDFEASLDRQIAALPRMTDLEVRRLYEKLERFYFAHVQDEARRAAFTRRLAGAAAAPSR